MTIDLAWRDAVRAACEPVFLAADAEFEWNDDGHFDEESPALLWEAEPQRFAERFPDSGIEESYGDQWPPYCIDYWIYVDPKRMTATLSPEGWNVFEETMSITGDGARDGKTLAAWFSGVLGLRPTS